MTAFLELGMPKAKYESGLLLYLQRGPGILSWYLVEVLLFSLMGSWGFWVSFFRLLWELSVGLG